MKAQTLKDLGRTASYSDKVVLAIVKNITEGTTKYIRFDGSIGEESL